MSDSEQVPLEAPLEAMHGSLGSKEWASPIRVVKFDADARPGIAKAHEYNDTPEVLQEKVRVLANLIRESKNSIVFTGAGISTAAGISDYATKAKGEVDFQWTEKGVQILNEMPRDHPKFIDVQSVIGAPAAGDVLDSAMTKLLRDENKFEIATSKGAIKLKPFDWMDANPTKAHRVLAAMYEEGMFKNWVQQNHDSLPQKAGFPQHALNEIHGSLHDPANPVIEINGWLRGDLSKWLEEWSEKNDLCLALGCSLSGFNVDYVPQLAAERAKAGTSSGLVLINLQQTQYDDLSSLRIFAKLDVVFTMLADYLDLTPKVKSMDHIYQPTCAEGSIVEEDVFLVPFDETGCPSAKKTTWDLRSGRRVKIMGGPYEGCVGEIVGKSKAGHYRISCRGFKVAGNAFADADLPEHLRVKRPFSLWLGNWWLEAATKGFGIMEGGKIPFVNALEEAEKIPDAIDAPVPEALPTQRTTKAKAPPPPSQGGKAQGKGKVPYRAKETHDACYCQ
jgi:NAD-dependent SIR2 family protein deacetylase